MNPKKTKFSDLGDRDSDFENSEESLTAVASPDRANRRSIGLGAGAEKVIRKYEKISGSRGSGALSWMDGFIVASKMAFKGKRMT